MRSQKQNTQKAREIATARIEQQRKVLFVECMHDADLARYIADSGNALQISFELQFLWGLFREHVKGYDLPTGEHDRVKVHLVDWLVTLRGYKLRPALEEVNAVAALRDERDVLFQTISNEGSRAYSRPNDRFMYISYKALLDQRRSRGSA